MSDFQTRLSAALGASALNKGGLAEKTDVALSTVSRWFGGTIPKTEKLDQIANELGVNAKWLLTGDGPMRDQSDPIQAMRDGDFSKATFDAVVRGFPRDALLERLATLVDEAESGNEEAFNAARAVIKTLQKTTP